MEKVSEGIQKDIQERAGSYTPEWKFDVQSPDIGTALALVYAKMMEGTKKRFEKIWDKNKIAFLNELGASPLPAVPSHGYVQFLLVNEEVEGAEVPAGIEVLADDSTLPDGRVLFETKEDIYVTPAALSDVYLTCDKYDMICEYYDRKKADWKPFRMFAPQNPNLQKHEIYFSHDTLFDIQGASHIEVAWIESGSKLISQDLLRDLCNQEKAVFEYYSEEGWVAFDVPEIGQDGLVFYKAKEKPGFARTAIAGQEGYWMRCRILKFKEFAGMYLEGIRLCTWNKGMPPDTVFGAQEECSVHRYFPFGERLDLYQEVYFGSQEVLSKKGAQITFSFGLSFVRIPLDTNQEKSFQREWVIKQSDFKPDREFEVTIESVIWEYFNGSGWARLFTDGSHGQIFSDTAGGYRTLCFTCPEDIERILVNAVDTYYIRARIMKVNNLYKLNGYFVVPVMENTAFRYSYQEARPWVQRYVFQNNMESRMVQGGFAAGLQACKPFVQTGLDGTGIYFGFEVPPIGIPVKVLFQIANDADRSERHLLWEYWAGKRWKHLSMVDETEYLSRTGIVTFTGSPDMARRRLFGKERYWLRICDEANAYIEDNTSSNLLPVLKRVCMNTTTVKSFCGGLYTNLEEGRIDRLGTHIGYISQVTNPGAMTGGCDAESVNQAMKRVCASIRNQGRAVCARDYEELAMCAARQLLMAKCFAGFDCEGERMPGAVTLVVLPRQFQQEQVHFAELRERILQYMEERISFSLKGRHRLFVVLPELIEVCLLIEVLAEDYSQVFGIRREMTRRLEEFFQPAGLREGGWDIGSFPETVQIHNAVNDIKGIVQIQRIVMSTYKAGTARQQEEDLEKVRRRRYVLPVGGSHNIVVKLAERTHRR